MTHRSTTFGSLIRPLACAVSLAALAPVHAAQVAGNGIGQVIQPAKNSGNQPAKPGQPAVSPSQPAPGVSAPAKPQAPAAANSGNSATGGSPGPAPAGR